MSVRCLLLALVACQGDASSHPPAARPVIEARDASGMVIARVLPGHPCRATVEGSELIVGGRPLIAQHGSARWTGQDAANGTTLLKNDQPTARIHAKQLFDGEGVPLVRIMDNGDIANGAGRVVRKARAEATKITIATVERGGVNQDVTVTGLGAGAEDVALAAMLTAPEAIPEVRALAACHYLLHDEAKL